jgi:hypothetical protein
MLGIAACGENTTAPASSEPSVSVALSKATAEPNICHRTKPKNGIEWEAMWVAEKGIAGHLKHGDALLGEGQTCPPSASLSLTGDGSYDSADETHTFTLTNTGNGSTGTLVAPSLTNPSENGAAFQITGTTCTGTTLAAGASCTIDLRFYVTDCSGQASATLNVGDGTLLAQSNVSGSYFTSCVECLDENGNPCLVSYARPATVDWIILQRRT